MLLVAHDPGKGNPRLLACFSFGDLAFVSGLKHNQKRKQYD
jgi:hypothetical protein